MGGGCIQTIVIVINEIQMNEIIDHWILSQGDKSVEYDDYFDMKCAKSDITIYIDALQRETYFGLIFTR